jgi:hypothetical protein
MTMPHERARVLRGAGEVLRELLEDSTLPSDLIEKVRPLAAIYPSVEEIDTVLEDEAASFRPEWRQAFIDVWELFRTWRGRGTEQTAHSVAWVMRHYPDPEMLDKYIEPEERCRWLQIDEPDWRQYRTPGPPVPRMRLDRDKEKPK